MRYKPKNKADVDKISQALQKLGHEDLTMRTVNDSENRQTLLYGMGERAVVQIADALNDGMDVQDTQCGFKLFRMDVMRTVFAAQRIERFAFDVELIRRARDAGGTVKEVPVAWCGGKRSSLRVFRDAPRMLWDLLRIGPCRALSRDRTRAGR